MPIGFIAFHLFQHSPPLSRDIRQRKARILSAAMFTYRMPWFTGFLTMTIRDMKHSRLKRVHSLKHPSSQAFIPKLVFSRLLPPDTLSHLLLYDASLSSYSYRPSKVAPSISV
jgi:hypothetical protein